MHRCFALCPRPVVRSASLPDAPHIFRLIQSLSGDGTLLPRPLAEIEAHIDSFFVAETHGGEFLGCAAIHRYGPHLAEVRSIATRLEARGLGAGGMLLQRVLEDVKNSGTPSACLFTKIPTFFARYGFHTVPLASMRDKVAKDCIHCARREHCDEIAMVAGDPPVLWPVSGSAPQSSLIQIGRR